MTEPRHTNSGERQAVRVRAPEVGSRDELAAAVEWHAKMVLSRRFEEETERAFRHGKIGGYLHVYTGQEAVAAGFLAELRDDDIFFTGYRDHTHALLRGSPPGAVMAELYGKATGLAKGKGGSMHLFDASKNFLGGYAIVGGMLPVATGLALASSYQGKRSIACAFFGDGAVNEGEFHEALNLAALWKLPVLFFLENNGYGMGTAIARAASYAGHIYRLAEGYGIPTQRIVGQSVLEVYQATRSAVDKMRAGEGPQFIEAITYRYRGHSMADPMEYRDKAEEEQWRARDPILLFRQALEKNGTTTAKEFGELQQAVDSEVEEAAKFADESPTAPLEAIYEDIYAE